MKLLKIVSIHLRSTNRFVIRSYFHKSSTIYKSNTMKDIENGIEEAAKAIKNAEAILITAGAGIGVDSG